MSDHPPPSTLQPPSSIETQTSMAQTQWQPKLPASRYLGQPEYRSPSSYTLPPVRGFTPISPDRGNGNTLPSMQLPPIRSTPVQETPRKAMDIALLLSDSPSSPPRSQPIPQQYPRRSPPSTPLNASQPYSQHSTPYTVRQPQPSPIDYSRLQKLQMRNNAVLSPPRPRSVRPSNTDPSPITHRSPQPTPTASTPDHPSASSFRKPASRISITPPLNYTLSIRQQPIAARACGFGERDRRVIDPPPILELRITDKVSGAPEQDPNGMLALHCTLLSRDGCDDETELPPSQPDLPNTRRLMGTLVASPYQAKDEHGVAGTFFVFPDLSCRSPGKFRLRFRLIRIDPTNMLPGAVCGTVANVTTDVFSVYTAKDFPGMRASSALLKTLRRQGLNVGVKKGSEARKGKAGGDGKGKGRGKARKAGSDSEEDEDEEDDDGDGTAAAVGARRASVQSMVTASTAGDVSPKSSVVRRRRKKRRRDS